MHLFVGIFRKLTTFAILSRETILTDRELLFCGLANLSNWSRLGI